MGNKQVEEIPGEKPQKSNRRSNLTNEYLNKLTPQTKIFRVWDAGKGSVSGLHFLVRPSGKRAWYLLYSTPDGKRPQIKIGNGAIPLRQAREIATMWLAEVAKGEDVKAKMKKSKPPQQLVPPKKDPTIGEIRETYKSWLLPEIGTPPLKSGKTTLRTIDSFKKYFSMPTSKFTTEVVAEWVQNCRKRQNKGISINLRWATMKAMLNWAKKQNLLEEDFLLPNFEKQSLIDSDPKVRYLTVAERKRLYETLEEREKKGGGKDYLKIAVIIANYTGIRRSSLLGLRWQDISELPDGTMSLHLLPWSSKSKKKYDVPLSERVKIALREWKEFSIENWGEIKPEDFVIRYRKKGVGVADIKRAWKTVLASAKIENFRFHDLRHDFASQLVMSGVDLYTVQKLMTHETIQMTQRYAHLAPEKQKHAADKLNTL